MKQLQRRCQCVDHQGHCHLGRCGSSWHPLPADRGCLQGRLKATALRKCPGGARRFPPKTQGLPPPHMMPGTAMRRRHGRRRPEQRAVTMFSNVLGTVAEQIGVQRSRVLQRSHVQRLRIRGAEHLSARTYGAPVCPPCIVCGHVHCGTAPTLTAVGAHRAGGSMRAHAAVCVRRVVAPRVCGIRCPLYGALAWSPRRANCLCKCGHARCRVARFWASGA